MPIFFWGGGSLLRRHERPIFFLRTTCPKKAVFAHFCGTPLLCPRQGRERLGGGIIRSGFINPHAMPGRKKELLGPLRRCIRNYPASRENFPQEEREIFGPPGQPKKGFFFCNVIQVFSFLFLVGEVGRRLLLFPLFSFRQIRFTAPIGFPPFPSSFIAAFLVPFFLGGNALRVGGERRRQNGS